MVISHKNKNDVAYNKFKLKDLKVRFGIENLSLRFLPENIAPFNPSQQLLNELIDVEGIALASKKAKSEHIVTPVIKELRRKNINRFSYFSGYSFDVDVKQGLSGYCDLIFSAKPHRIEIESPIFVL